MLSLTMLLSLLFSFLIAESWDHLVGVPPGFVRHQLIMENENRPIEIIGTLNPPQVLINGQKIHLEKKVSDQSKKGLFFNGQKIFTQGKQGRFYSQLLPERLNSQRNRIEIYHKGRFWEGEWLHPRIFVEKKHKQTLWFQEGNEAKQWLWQGLVPEGTIVEYKGRDLKTDKGQISIAIDLQRNKQMIPLVVRYQKVKRTVNIRVEHQIKSYSDREFYLSLRCQADQECSLPINVGFNGKEMKGVTQPDQKLTIQQRVVDVKESGEFSFTLNSNCEGSSQQQVEMTSEGRFGTFAIQKPLVSSDCLKWQQKNKSRFYFAFGLGHFGLLDSPAPGVKTMMSENLEISPRLGLGLRLYDKIYIDLRFASIKRFRSSDGNHKTFHMDFNALSMGYPFRGRWFAALGFASYKTDYNRSNDPFFQGDYAKWAASLFIEVGHRFHISPSWTLNSRALMAPSFLSLQSDPWRKWPFFMIEPISLEYHFL